MVVVVDRAAVVFDDHVFPTDAGPVGRRTGRYAEHERPHRPRHAEAVGVLRRECLVERHPEVGTMHLPVLDELPAHEHHHRDRDREADPLAAAGVAGDGRVEPDHLAANVDQRPTAVARIDGRVGLDEVLEANPSLAEVEVAPALGRDDAQRHRMGEAEGAADGQHGVADLQRILLGEPGGLQIVGLDVEHRDVGVGVGPGPLGVDLAAVVESEQDVVEVSPIDDVTVGDDHRPSGHPRDHAGPRLLLGRLAVPRTGQRLGGGDVHDRRPEELREPAQVPPLPLEHFAVLGNLLVEPVTVGGRQTLRGQGIGPLGTGPDHRRHRGEPWRLIGGADDAGRHGRDGHQNPEAGRPWKQWSACCHALLSSGDGLEPKP